MKKLLSIAAALALVLGLSQCRKPNMPAINGGSGEIQHVVLNATIDNGGSKIAENGTGGIKWSVGDEIAVKQGETPLGTLTCKNASGTFEGDITSTTGDIQFTFGTQSFENQTGALNSAISLTSGDVAYNAEGKYNVTMNMPHAVLKLDLSALGTAGGNVVTIKDGNTPVASVTGVTNVANNPYYVAMPAAASKEYTFSGNSINVVKEWALAANTFYTKEGSSTGEAIVVTASTHGCLSGEFSVSATTKVKFSQGNLQYIGSAAVPYWKFAENQYDYLGTTTGQNSDAENVDRDLFGWGTSGYNHGATCYQPWSTNQLSVYYYAYGSSSNHLYSSTGQADWGYNAISNGGGTENSGWRTLTNAEWEYLFNTRTVNGGTGAGKSYQSTTLTLSDATTVYGMLLLPDNFTGSVSGTTSWADWQTLESSGVVFLPAAGYRNGTSLYGTGSSGYYWSSSYNGNDYAYNLYFFSVYVLPQNNSCLGYGYSVRLVR